jgi:hypothetical protein
MKKFPYLKLGPFGNPIIPVWVSISGGHWKISIHFQKIREIVIALLKRNLISAWPPMWKSDFRMPPHEEIILHRLFSRKISNCAIFFTFFEKSRQIEAWNRNIAWLTPTGIQFPNGPWVSGIKISSSLGFKKTLKLALGKEKLTSCGPTALGRKAFLPVG